MKRLFLTGLLILSVTCVFSQGHRITIGSGTKYFNDFSERSVLFTGLSGELSFLIKRVSIDISIGYCFPRTYYGRARYYAFTDYEDKQIWVYSKGGVFSLGYSLAYNFYKPKSEIFLVSASLGFGFLNHRGHYNSEQFIRIYGGYDDIHIYFLNLNGGLQFIYRAGSIPVSLKITRNFPTGKREYNSFITSGYFQVEAGVAFPFLKSPPPDKIYKLEY